MQKTAEQYKKQGENCKKIFQSKLKDYGVAWRILRLPSLTDQIYIKASRIRNLQTITNAKIDENQQVEFNGIVNYAIISLIQLDLGIAHQPDISNEKAIELYDKTLKSAFELMQKKNHDYGEAWREMRVSSITDLILQKLLRIKQIEDNKGETIVSEGLDANYYDIVNYAIFSLILLDS